MTVAFLSFMLFTLKYGFVHILQLKTRIKRFYLIEYENIDKNNLKMALKKFGGHLWYLNPETAAFAMKM